MCVVASDLPSDGLCILSDWDLEEVILRTGEGGLRCVRGFGAGVKVQNTVGSIETNKLMFPQHGHIDASVVWFSCRVNGRTYRADLEVQASIAPDRCCWEMKSNEPVLKLVKEQQGFWERLVRNKVMELILFNQQQKRELILRSTVQKPVMSDEGINEQTFWQF